MIELCLFEFDEQDPLCEKYCAELSNYLNQQTADTCENSQSVLAHLKHWCETRKAKFFFCVLGDKTVVGSISLSRLDPINGTARVGYEIYKPFQNKGYGRAAFHQIIEIAKSLDIKSLHSTIKHENQRSIALWEKSGFPVSKDGENISLIIAK